MSIVDKILAKIKKPTPSPPAPKIEIFTGVVTNNAFCGHCREPLDRGQTAYAYDKSGRGFCSIPCTEEFVKLEKEFANG